MDPPKLFVKSEIIIPTFQFQQGIRRHPCTDAYVAKEIVKKFKPEDEEAINLLNEAGIDYKLVDLSDCPFTVRIKAKILGINKTPTLVLGNGEKIEGVRNIRQAILKIEG